MLSAVSINTSTISKNSVQAVDQTLPYKIFPTVLLSVYQSLLNNFHSLEVISYANFSARTMFILITHLCFNVHHYFFCILKNHIGKYNVSIYSQFLLLTIFLYTQQYILDLFHNINNIIFCDLCAAREIQDAFTIIRCFLHLICYRILIRQLFMDQSPDCPCLYTSFLQLGDDIP